MAEEKKSTQASPEAKAPTAAKKKAKKRKLIEGRVYINATYNNTIISVTEMSGGVVAWASSGSCGFKGTRKATPYAASVAAETAINKAKAMGLEKVHIITKGVGNGRDQAIRAINTAGLSIETLSDTTAVPHNGCRPRKARRI